MIIIAVARMQVELFDRHFAVPGDHVPYVPALRRCCACQRYVISLLLVLEAGGVVVHAYCLCAGFAIYKYVEYKNVYVNWGSGQRMQCYPMNLFLRPTQGGCCVCVLSAAGEAHRDLQALNGLMALRGVRDHIKTYRPHYLVFTGQAPACPFSEASVPQGRCDELPCSLVPPSLMQACRRLARIW